MCVHASLITIKHAMQLKCTETLFVLDHSVRRIPTFLFRLSRVDVSAQMCSDNAACFESEMFTFKCYKSWKAQKSY